MLSEALQLDHPRGTGPQSASGEVPNSRLTMTVLMTSDIPNFAVNVQIGHILKLLDQVNVRKPIH